MNDNERRFHEEWLGLIQPIEGLVFSVPVLADAEIAAHVRPEITTQLKGYLEGPEEAPRLRSTREFFAEFLGYGEDAAMLVDRDALPSDVSFYAVEGKQEIRPSFAIARLEDDPKRENSPYIALVWDLATDAGADLAPALSLDRAESSTGPWSYPPTAKFERLLRKTRVPIGFLSNGRELRLLYAAEGQSSGHLTFRFAQLNHAAGRSMLAALSLLFSAHAAYGASEEKTYEGLLAESRRRQADVTHALAEQVFEAVEILLAGFELAATRDCVGDAPDWLRAALEHEGDHLYQGVLSVVLRLVFLLYSEDQGLLPVDNDFYAENLSVLGLYESLADDAGAHVESMHHRYGAYGRLLNLFRAVFLGVQHGDLRLPPRRGQLFDPSAYPFLEGGLPTWTSAIQDAGERAATQPPSLDDGTLHDVLRRLIVFEGQRLSYRALDVEQIGSVYESLMGYHVRRLESDSVRVGKHGVWVEAEALLSSKPADREQLLKEVCGLSGAQVTSVEAALQDIQGKKPNAKATSSASAAAAEALLEVLEPLAPGGKKQLPRHRAQAGRLVLQPGDERRRSGSHYTPRKLTQGIVQRTLEPILKCLGAEPTPEQILSLKVCDPAMGSGAFLVETCRHLAEALVAAWTRSGELSALTETWSDPLLHAHRLVAQRCLYGVDKNPAAVELAKLSLWLVTLSRELPFTFVDHALRHGDSLVGLSLEQISAFDWAPKAQLETMSRALNDALEQSLQYRAQILELADKEDPFSQRDKQHLLDYAQQATNQMRMIADICVGAFFAEGKDTARRTERERRLHLVNRFLHGESDLLPDLQDLADRIRAQHAPFHWMLEFPEVFYEERPDPLAGGEANGAAFMEAFVGNPPFLGGPNISVHHGAAYVDWLKTTVSGDRGNRGQCDLSAFFLRRAATLLGEHGAFGFIATNTIAQGDTRSIGLQHLVGDGWAVIDVTSPRPWPGTAAVTVLRLVAARGTLLDHARLRFDGADVSALNSRLAAAPERSDAVPLLVNQGASFRGVMIYGNGFALSHDERDTLLQRDRRNALRIHPYLGGQEVNSSPTQAYERYVIDFGDAPLHEAEEWTDLIHVVRTMVKPERDKLPPKNSVNVDRRTRWWQFAGRSPEMLAAIRPLERCLVTSQVSKHLMFSFQPTDRVFSHKLFVFPLPAYTAFAVLQSRVHEPWTWLLSSTMKTDLNYSASDCFQTFPFPQTDPRAVIPTLEAAGRNLYQARADYMRDTDQGLTKTYNALKDPDNTDSPILHLRGLHESMDRAVLDSYGWTDLSVPPYCPLTNEERQFLKAFQDEVIDRLYVLNTQRAREEAEVALGSDTTRKKRAAKSPAKGTKGGKDGRASKVDTSHQKKLL
jgi:hypothetical protein